mgnify:CR=1 FL=1|jgi:hypothetical protein
MVAKKCKKIPPLNTARRMIQIIEQTDEEKFRMYNKFSKKELIIMLIEANKHLRNREPIIN